MDSSGDDFSRPQAGGDANDGPAAPGNAVSPASPAPAEDAPLTQPAEQAAAGLEPPAWSALDWDVPDEAGPAQGLWLTASAWLPPELLSSGDRVPGAAGPAGFARAASWTSCPRPAPGRPAPRVTR